MHILPHHRIRLEMGVKLTTASKVAKRHFGLDARYADEILDHVMSVIRNCIVLRPDTVGMNTETKLGEFGVSEPHPHPELIDKWTGY